MKFAVLKYQYRLGLPNHNTNVRNFHYTISSSSNTNYVNSSNHNINVRSLYSYLYSKVAILNYQYQLDSSNCNAILTPIFITLSNLQCLNTNIASTRWIIIASYERYTCLCNKVSTLKSSLNSTIETQYHRTKITQFDR